MIDRLQIRRLSLAAIAVSIVAGATAYFATRSAAVGLGVPAGALLGLIPFVTWAWLLVRLLERKSILLFGLITIAKLGLYGVALYFLVYQNRVHPMALGAGVGLSALALGIGFLLQERGTHSGSRA